jgi:S1-C subfamily serine protease
VERGKGRPDWGDIAADTFRVIAEAQMPTVVSLQTLSARHAAGQPFPEELRRFFGLPEFGGEERMLEGAGTGFIIDRSGLILTNNHVVEGATRIQVSFFPRPDADPADVQHLDARVLGRDPITDSALRARASQRSRRVPHHHGPVIGVVSPGIHKRQGAAASQDRSDRVKTTPAQRTFRETGTELEACWALGSQAQPSRDGTASSIRRLTPDYPV